MKLAIIHYHLAQGGVTRVIANQLQALDRALGSRQAEVLLLHAGEGGGLPAELQTDFDNLSIANAHRVALGYDERGGTGDAALLYRELRESLSAAGFEPQDTVVQVHNPSLGKNLALPGALARLALAGYRLLLQLHDFAEDYRPHLYRKIAAALDADAAGVAENLYPQAPQIHYALINSRDRAILARAGIAESRLHLLPNPVYGLSLPDREKARSKLEHGIGVTRDARFFLYPVRGILRKNVGEALLWALMLRPDGCVAVSLPPLSAVDLDRYARWQEVARVHALPCLFDVGAGTRISYPELLAGADALLTTSVAEGFGMVFLEAWLGGRPLVGRDLPAITADFKAQGLDLGGLGAELRVPVGWIGRQTFLETFVGAYRKVLTACGAVDPGDRELARQSEQLIVENAVDFARLTPPLQEQVLARLIDSGDCQQRLLELNPWMAADLAGATGDTKRLIDSNARVVREAYGESATGRHMLATLDAVRGSAVADTLGKAPDGQRILEEFLDLASFRPARTER